MTFGKGFDIIILGVRPMKIYVVVLCFILFDILTGILKALYKGKINSTTLRKGLFHKLSEMLAVAGSGLLEYASQVVELGVELPLVSGVSIYVCIMELISIIENLCIINPKLKKLFSSYLEKLGGE